MSGIWLLYSTFGARDEALSAAHALIEEGLVACASVMENVTSVYRWEGKIVEASEVALIAKTSKDKYAAASDRIKSLHSYEMPCIVAWELAAGYPPFLQWVVEETTK